jgi:4-alpha-glucanotransferase
MRIKFNIAFHTEYGQNIYITGSLPELGEFDSSKAVPLSYNEGTWSTSVHIAKKTDFDYSYIIKDSNSVITCESGPSRKFHVYGLREYHVIDEWSPFTDESPFLSDAFRKVFYKRDSQQYQNDGSIIITCAANNLSTSDSLYISGSIEELGNWDISKKQPMHINCDGRWEYIISAQHPTAQFEYKFLLSSGTGDNESIVWEHGNNRIFRDSGSNLNSKIIINHFSLNLPSAKPRFAGTAIPVFSLRSKESSGIGDFFDIKEMVDLLNVTGQRVLQILPVNDTTMTHTWTDSYPYGAISIFALHPLYINLKGVGIVKENGFMKRYKEKAEELNMLESVDYDSVSELKREYLTKIFSESGTKTFQSKDYKIFFTKNSEWLIPYAAYCYLRDKFKSADFSKWPEYSNFDSIKILELTSPKCEHYNEIAIHYFIQYHLHHQLSEVHQYANSKGIILKGDIPIGVNKYSVDAWVDPQYFNFNGQAGAPPDDFSVKGQNWGFPTYNWDKIEKDDFSWWKRRFRKMGEYFDAYRIDHILGFFRIWEIPTHSVEGLMGHFNPSLPLSEQEIRSFGYNFHYDRDCTPYIREYILNDYFGYDKTEISEIFLENIGWETYRLKNNLNTQTSIENYFATTSSSHLSKYKDPLLSLCSEVLFIPDPVDSTKFHPRISAQLTKSYISLSQEQKDSFNNLYNHFYYNRNNDFWYRSAMKKLPNLISATGMLVCGEDLGMIPACVPSAMKSLSILTLEIQRMPKETSNKFGNPSNYPYLSVCSTGSHDTSTLRGWWEEDYENSKIYFKDFLGENSTAPFYCEPWICNKIIDSHLYSPSMLVVLPLQDWLSMFGNLRKENPDDERINVPSNPNHYWRYRMHVRIDELINNKEFTTSLREQIQKSGRI